MQQARDGVVAPPVFFGQVLDLEPGLELGHRHDAVNQPAAVFALGRPGIDLRAGLQLAGDGFQHVHGRHQALHHAVFIDYKHDAGGAGAKLLDQFHAGQCLGYKHGRNGMVANAVGHRGGKARTRQAVHVCACQLGLKLPAQGQQLGHIDHTHHVI